MRSAQTRILYFFTVCVYIVINNSLNTVGNLMYFTGNRKKKHEKYTKKKLLFFFFLHSENILTHMINHQRFGWRLNDRRNKREIRVLNGNKLSCLPIIIISENIFYSTTYNDKSWRLHRVDRHRFFNWRQLQLWLYTDTPILYYHCPVTDNISN